MGLERCIGHGYSAAEQRGLPGGGHSCARRRPLQRLHHARAHLRRGLLRKSNGDDLFRLIHHREQLQVALYEQLGFAGPGRRLHDERRRGIQRASASGGVTRPHRMPPAWSNRECGTDLTGEPFQNCGPVRALLFDGGAVNLHGFCGSEDITILDACESNFTSADCG